MKTGFFRQLKNNHIPGVVSISLEPSGYNFVLFEYKSLCPNWKLSEKFNSKKINEDFFYNEFYEQLNQLSPKETYDNILTLVKGNEPILMTHGNKSKFCHRHIVAEWFTTNLGIQIEEYKTGKVLRKKGYMQKIKNPTLF